MQRILVLVDFSEVTGALVAQAAQLARSGPARVLLLHVEMPDSEFDGQDFRPDVSREGVARQIRQSHRALESIEQELKARGVDATAMLVRGDSTRGNAAPKIVEELHRLRPDLVVVGSHGHGRLRRLMMGSVSESVLHHADRPVLVVPSPPGTGESDRFSGRRAAVAAKAD
jgi:nucleotide-binding universal stress UspA family protein